MVVANILGEEPSQVALVHGDDVVQQVTPAASHPTLRNSILPGAPQRSANTFDFHRSDGGGDLRPIFGVAIEDDESRSRPKWKSLSQLLHDPPARRIPGGVEVQDASTVVSDYEEAIEHAESDRGDREEIHCSNGFSVIPQKGKPTSGSFWVSRCSFHPAGDRSLRDIKTEHEKLAMDARRAPAVILGNHAED